MKKGKSIVPLIVSIIMLLGNQSCFQNLDNDPPFNYPQGNETPDPDPDPEPQPDPDPADPLLLFFPFEDNIEDNSEFMFTTTGVGNINYATGIKGNGYQGADNTYILINNNSHIDDLVTEKINNLGSFSVSFWMNSAQPNTARSIFSITNTTEFWSNLDIMFDNHSVENEGRFRVHIINSRIDEGEKWSETFIPDVFNRWAHLGVTYDAATSLLSVYVDGELFDEEDWADCGEIVFTNLGPMIIGTFPFQTDPSLTSGSDAQDWAGFYDGILDQFRFYTKTLTAEEIKALYDSKE